nr:radical SAM protein [Burkholderiales bacterium]
VLIRLPHELKALFKDWLAEHYPLRADHVMSVIRQMRGGKEYDSDFATRHSGTGNYAELLQKRFDIACRRLGLNQERAMLETKLFSRPDPSAQMKLF